MGVRLRSRGSPGVARCGSRGRASDHGWRGSDPGDGARVRAGDERSSDERESSRDRGARFRGKSRGERDRAFVQPFARAELCRVAARLRLAGVTRMKRPPRDPGLLCRRRRAHSGLADEQDSPVDTWVVAPAATRSSEAETRAPTFLEGGVLRVGDRLARGHVQHWPKRVRHAELEGEDARRSGEVRAAAPDQRDLGIRHHHVLAETAEKASRPYPGNIEK
jgi:hypothetical protein